MRKYSLLIIVLLKSVSMFGQSSQSAELKGYSPKSPEATQFLRYGEYPVNLSTGLVDIKIPIYEIKVGEFELPIDIGYHPSGIKVEDEASMVGLGWNLSGGAQIVLEVRDVPDEYIEANYNEIPNAVDVNTYISQNSILGYTSNYLIELRNNKNSWIRDVYNFSSPTANGKFIIDKLGQDSEITIYPPNSFKVELIGPGNSKFKITDTYGNIYSFSETKEYSKVLQQYALALYTTAWFVDRIETNNHVLIDFTYENGGDITNRTYNEVIRQTKLLTPNYSCIVGAELDTEKIVPVENMDTNYFTTTKKIKEINFPEGRILFNSSDGRLDFNYSTAIYPNPIHWPKKLDNIEIQKKANETNTFETIRKFQFNYSYFVTNTPPNQLNPKDYRLKLDGISDILTPDEPKVTNFIYSDIKLPPKDSNSIDYWGYYNAESNANCIPHQIVYYYPHGIGRVDESIGNANREVNPNVIEAAILKEIQYPTKGKTNFEYEPNTYFGVNKFDQYELQLINSNLVQGTGSGEYVAESAQNETECLQNANECIKYSYIPFNAVNANAILTFQHNNSSGYSDVTTVKHQFTRVQVYAGSQMRYDSQKDNSLNHAVTESFNINGSGYVLISAYGEYMSVSNFELKYYNNDTTPKNNYGMGVRIKSITNYDLDINNFTNKKVFEYTKKNKPIESSGILVRDNMLSYQVEDIHYSASCCNMSNPGGGGSFGCDWKEFTTKYYQSNSNSGEESNAVSYSEVMERSIDPLGNSNGYSEYTFRTDPDAIFDNHGYIKVESNHKRGSLISKKDYKTINNSNSLIVREIYNTYKEDDSRTSYVKGFKLFMHSYMDSFPINNTTPRALSEMVEAVGYSIPVYWFYQNSSSETNYFYNLNNALTGTMTINKDYNYNNPIHLQLTSEVSQSSTGENIETNYNYAQDQEMVDEPHVAELAAKNMIGISLQKTIKRNNEVLSQQKTIYNTWGNNLLLPASIQVSKGNGSLENRVRYNAYDNYGHPLEVQQENGMIISYLWGYNQSQPIAKIENITNEQLKSALGVTDLNSVNETHLNAINALRNNPSYANSMITTYTYIPLVGVSTITDPRGMKTTYEYDSFGRLHSVIDNEGNILSENEYHYRTQN